MSLNYLYILIAYPLIADDAFRAVFLHSVLAEAPNPVLLRVHGLAEAFTRFSSDTTTGSVGVRPTGEEGEVESWDGKQTKSNTEAAKTRPEMSRIMVGCWNSFNYYFLRKVIDENETILTGAFLDCLDRLS